MLGAGQNRILGERLASFGAALIALDDGGGHLADKIGILAERLVHTAPTVAGDAQHGENVQCTPVVETSSAVARPAA